MRSTTTAAKVESATAPAGPTSGRAAFLQRKCACGTHTVGGAQCDECGKKQLQRKPAGRAEPEGLPESVHETLRSPGRPLDAATRSFMEPRFRHDFSGVRVHTDPAAAESARDVNALAYTVGQEVVFAAGRYDPHSQGGRKLLAHELTHTIQQGAGAEPVLNRLSLSHAGDPAEVEADAAAQAVASGGAFQPGVRGGMRLARQGAEIGGREIAPPDATQVVPMQVPPVLLQQPSCMGIVASREFSRGNDDLRECQYQTAHIVTRLLLDPCACSPTRTRMPVRFEYVATLDGKSFNDAAGTVPEVQASRFGSRISLREVGGATSGPLVHSGNLGRPGDPDDTLSQGFNLQATVPCAGGSAFGTVQVGLETIQWTITASSSRLDSASITLTEGTPNEPDRVPTPTVDLTGGATRYPAFPGTPRSNRCTCHPVTGNQLGANCPYRNAGAGFGG